MKHSFHLCLFCIVQGNDQAMLKLLEGTTLHRQGVEGSLHL
ncbi:MAG: hypothetical protein ACJAYN_003099 [Bermanella sp.]|jgi:hypothetical protein